MRARQPARLLFVPVSGAHGMGEYARSLAIAQAVSRNWPDAVVHFILSRQAPYAANPPFPATLVDSSATFHTAAVIEVLERLMPDVVIFDNAGRTAQLRAARRLGARVVYISSRPRQRRKAFRLTWMRMIDEHWIAYPEFLAGGLSFFERAKLKCLGRPAVRYLDVVMSRGGPPGAALARAGFAAGSYVLVVPGGGTGHPGAPAALGAFLAAARGLAARRVPTVYVGPSVLVAADAAAMDFWRPLGSLSQGELGELMRSARLIVTNGGSTLLQAIACGRPCIAVPIAKDQMVRARSCIAAGVAVAAGPDAQSILHRAEQLWANEGERRLLAERTEQLGLQDGIETALRALNRILG